MTVHKLEKVIREVVQKEEQAEEGSGINSCQDEKSKTQEIEEMLIEEQSELCENSINEEQE